MCTSSTDEKECLKMEKSANRIAKKCGHTDTQRTYISSSD